MTYKEKLLDPRWQKKRLEILDRDKWTCQYCDDTETTLHVHHIYYAKSGNPWDTDDSGLVTYCECCHSLEEHLCKKYPDLNVVEVVKKTSDEDIYLICLISENSRLRYMVFKYENKSIVLDATITFDMFQSMCLVYSKWHKLIDKYEPSLQKYNGKKSSISALLQ